MRVVDYNKTLKEALEGCKDIYNDIDTSEFDDDLIRRFAKIKDLSLLEKDILYLYSLSNNITELSRLYKVSPAFIRKEIKKINDKLK